jgi:hypothetical protein
VRPLIAIAVVACAGAQRGGEPGFEVFYPDTAAGVVAHAGKRVSVKPSAHCTRDDQQGARWTMTGATADALPPGVTLEDGQLAGIPKTAGSWTIHVTFHGLTCAGKSYPDQTVTLAVTVGS